MALGDLIIPYWLLFILFIGRAIYINKFIIIPTLKKYDSDYEAYVSFKKQNKQLEEYIKICKQYSLPDKHWKYMKRYNKTGFLLLIGWVILIITANPQSVAYIFPVTQP